METRLKQLIKQQRMNSAQFASEIGIAASSLHHIVSGRNNPSLEVIQKILKRFPNINAEWLINGNGKPYNTEISQGELFELENNYDNNQEKESFEQKQLNIQNISSKKEIEKIIIFYKDKSFDIYNS